MWKDYEEIFELLLINIIQNRNLACFLDEISTEKGKLDKNIVESNITKHIYASWGYRKYCQRYHREKEESG
jgi:hypothetical protein